MHILLIMWLYAVHVVTFKVCVDCFSLLYSNLLLGKWCPFEFGSILLNRIGNLLAYIAALFVTSVFGG